jgi:hypothetical protein
VYSPAGTVCRDGGGRRIESRSFEERVPGQRGGRQGWWVWWLPYFLRKLLQCNTTTSPQSPRSARMTAPTATLPQAPPFTLDPPNDQTSNRPQEHTPIYENQTFPGFKQFKVCCWTRFATSSTLMLTPPLGCSCRLGYLRQCMHPALPATAIPAFH